MLVRDVESIWTNIKCVLTDILTGIKMKTKDAERRSEEFLSKRFRRDYNSVRLNSHNTLDHELAKTKLSYFLIRNGNKILTEVVFDNGSRADILDLSNMVVYEILHSEKIEEALKKREYYPEVFEIVNLTSKEVLEEDFEW